MEACVGWLREGGKWWKLRGRGRGKRNEGLRKTRCKKGRKEGKRKE